MNKELVIVIDFGGQYNQLVARRVRECNVYCEIYSYKTDIAKIKAMNPKGIILTGGPNSCYEDGAPTCTEELFNLGVPVLGLCYGAQLMMHVLGGKVEKAPVREYGKTETFVDKSSALFGDVSEKTIVWMSHFDYISQVAPGFKIVAHTADCPVAAAECTEKNLYAIQFHPEVLHTQEGTKMLHNFVRGVCGCAGTWKMDAFVENTIKEIREKVGDGKVLLALSGGVDSSVAAGLLSRAIGKQLTCVFVDHGLMRKNEGDEVEAAFSKWDINLIRMNEEEAFLGALKGLTDPEDKRKAIGNPNKNIHHKKNGSNYQKDTGSMVRSTSARQEPEKMSTTMKVLIGVVFVVLGFIPKAGAVLSLIPSPVIGGIFLPAAASLISTGFNTLRKVESDDRTQVVIGLSLLLGIALPNALSGLEGGAHVFFSNSILVGAFSVVILKALIIDLPNFIARHADERTKQAE